VEHDEQAEHLEHEADKLDEESDRVGEHIDEARREWEAKEHDRRVPGAQPDPDEDEGTADEEDEGTADEEGEGTA
jgi:hypothetical protein